MFRSSSKKLPRHGRHLLIGAVAAASLLANAPSRADDFEVDQGNTTAHVPYQLPSDNPQPEAPWHYEMAPTWPIQVPIRVPDGVEGPSEEQHALENPGSNEIGERMQEEQSEPSE